MKRRVIIGVIGILLVTAGLGVTLLLLSTQDTTNDGRSATGSVSLIDEKLLKSWPAVDVSNADVSHLEKDMTPPTNTWYSGLALQSQPEPVFPYPNSFKANENGFEIGLPSVVGTPETITGGHEPGVIVTIDDASKYRLTRYDEMSIDLTYYSPSDDQLATVTIAAGSPYVYVKTDTDTKLNYGDGDDMQDESRQLDRGGKIYGVRTAGDLTTFYSVPDAKDFELLSRYALNAVTSTKVSSDSNNDTSSTTLTYSTKNNEPTLVAILPHQQQGSGEQADVTYDSILGEMTTKIGNTIQYSVPKVDLIEMLPIDTLDSSQKDKLRQQLSQDSARMIDDKTDTYFGGKQLQRRAQLLLLADQLGMDKEKTSLTRELNSRLSGWFSTNGAFKYDTKANTIVGKETSFGADTEINDHHFHYGYAIYAASVLARFDESFLTEHGAAVNLLVADIANYREDEALALRRNYDPYFGHSWASGTSPFKDGNNQESTSEAMNAWTAVALWGKQTGNKTLTEQGLWMLANETATAKEYWLTKPDLAGYESPIASIVWGGKREYKTFFSDDPNAKLAILLLPLNPSMREYANSIAKATFAGTSTARPFGDYLLMADPDATVQQAEKLPDSAIDDGNSRTYLYAYVMTK